jgi:hypothetical protein
MSAIRIDLDWAKMRLLLEKFQNGKLSRNEASELKPLLEKYYRKAVMKRDGPLATKLSIMLAGLNGIVMGDISEDEYRRISNVT